MRMKNLEFAVWMIPRPRDPGDETALYTVVFDTPTETVVSKEMGYNSATELHEEIRIRMIKAGVETIGAYNASLPA